MNIRQWYRGGQSGAAPLVDYTTYEVLYSISRKINPDYVGSAFRIIRDSDSTQTDIGFSGTEVDTAAIGTFCSGTIGRIQTVYNQGTLGSTFDVTYRRGTRSIIYQLGAVELVNGKAAMLGQTSNEYWSGLIDISNSLFNDYKFHSTVLETANGASNGWAVGEVGTAAGNNRRGQFASTATDRVLIDNIVTSLGISNGHSLLVQATQSQQRQYSFFNQISAVALEESRSYWNTVLQQERQYSLGWGDNTQFRMHLMRVSIFVFLGRFQEFALKTTDGSDDETELRALEAEQNAYYGIY